MDWTSEEAAGRGGDGPPGSRWAQLLAEAAEGGGGSWGRQDWLLSEDGPQRPGEGKGREVVDWTKNPGEACPLLSVLGSKSTTPDLWDPPAILTRCGHTQGPQTHLIPLCPHRLLLCVCF